MRELAIKKARIVWSRQHAQAIDEVRKLVISSPVLKFYDVDKEVAVQCELVVSASEQTYYRLDSRWRLRQELSLSFGKKICSNRKGVSSNSASYVRCSVSIY